MATDGPMVGKADQGGRDVVAGSGSDGPGREVLATSLMGRVQIEKLRWAEYKWNSSHGPSANGEAKMGRMRIEKLRWAEWK